MERIGPAQGKIDAVPREWMVPLATGLILPLALGAMLVAARRRDIVGDYRHPLWMSLFGWAVALAMAAMAAYTLATAF